MNVTSLQIKMELYDNPAICDERSGLDNIELRSCIGDFSADCDSGTKEGTICTIITEPCDDCALGISVDLTDPLGSSFGPFDQNSSPAVVLTPITGGVEACVTFDPNALSGSSNGLWTATWSACSPPSNTFTGTQTFYWNSSGAIGNVVIDETNGPVDGEEMFLDFNNTCDVPGKGDPSCGSCPCVACPAGPGSLVLKGPVTLNDTLKVNNARLCDDIVLDNVTLDKTLEINDSCIYDKISLKNTTVTPNAPIFINNTNVSAPITLEDVILDGNLTVTNSCVNDVISLLNNTVVDSTTFNGTINFDSTCVNQTVTFDSCTVNESVDFCNFTISTPESCSGQTCNTPQFNQLICP